SSLTIFVIPKQIADIFTGIYLPVEFITQYDEGSFCVAQQDKDRIVTMLLVVMIEWFFYVFHDAHAPCETILLFSSSFKAIRREGRVQCFLPEEFAGVQGLIPLEQIMYGAVNILITINIIEKVNRKGPVISLIRCRAARLIRRSIHVGILHIQGKEELI